MATEQERLAEELDALWQIVERARQLYEDAIDRASKLPTYGVTLAGSLSFTELGIGSDQRMIDLIRREVKSC